MLSAPDAEPWNPANLLGRLTVLTVLGPVSANLDAVGRWNALVDQFAGRPVQFVWVASEYQPPLGPWLQKHPVKGWLLLDPLGATALAYGMEEPAALLIGSDRRILGFDRSMVPEARTIEAALGGGEVRLDAESPRMPRPGEHRPRFAPSLAVHIASAQGERPGESRGSDYWSFEGLDLRDILMHLCGTTRERIQLPPALDDRKRYNVALVLPAAESEDSMAARMLRGIEDYFHVTFTPETRPMEVYVVTATGGSPPAAETRGQASGCFKASRVEFQVAAQGLPAPYPSRH